MTAKEERQHLLTLRERYAASLRQLEVQAANYGISVPVSMQNEIDLLKDKIGDIDKVLRPPRMLSREVFATMDEIERMQYSTTLALELQQAFGELRSEVRRRDGTRAHERAIADVRHLLTLAAFAVLGLAGRPTFSWHVFLFIGVFLLVLGWVLFDLYKAGKD